MAVVDSYFVLSGFKLHNLKIHTKLKHEVKTLYIFMKVASVFSIDPQFKVLSLKMNVEN